MTTKKQQQEAEDHGDFSTAAFAEADQHLYDRVDDFTISAEEAEQRAKDKGELAARAAKDADKELSDNKAENQEMHRNAAQHKAAHPDD
jgi:hypothetical protein